MVELNNYLIDTVKFNGEQVTSCGCGGAVQMITYRVAAVDAPSALKRFTDEEAGEVIYTGEPTNFIIIGIDKE